MSDKHRTGLAAEDLKQAFLESVIYDQARQPGRATRSIITWQLPQPFATV